MRNINDLLLTLGISGTYKGYHLLIASLEMALDDPDRLVSYSTAIFPAIARKYQTNIKCVERNIRTVIEICWNSDYRDELLRISPYRLDSRPSVGEFLDILFWQLS